MSDAPFFEEDMTNIEFWAALMTFTKITTTQAHIANNHFFTESNKVVGPQPNASTSASTIRDFMRMNPPTFHGTMFYYYQHGFIKFSTW